MLRLARRCSHPSRNISALALIILTGFLDKTISNIPAMCQTHTSQREFRVFGDRDWGDDLTAVYHFASILSVRRIYRLNIVGSAETYEANMGFDSGCTSVRAIQDIHFEPSALGAQAFGYLLSDITA